MNFKSCFFAVFVMVFALTASVLSAAEYITKTAESPAGYKYEYVENDPFNGRIYTLKNGFKVYLSREKSKPRVSLKIAVRAGMADSPAQSTGLAHYFEHMMFKGTAKMGALDWKKEKPLLDKIEELFEARRKTNDPAEKEKIYAEIDKLSSEAAKYAVPGEYSKLVSSIGGMGLNAFTGSDETVYFADVPSPELEKFLMLESERFSAPVMRLFHTELETIYEEFNRSQNSDGRVAYEELCKNLFKSHPYGWMPNIGKPEHLKNPSVSDIYSFFSKYYVPGNMTIMISGDIDYDSTIKLVDKYFASFPAKDVLKRDMPKEETIKENVAVEVSGPEAETVMLGWRYDTSPENDIMADLVAKILRNGTSGLMDTNLVRSQKLLGAGAYAHTKRDYGMFVMNAVPRNGQTLDDAASLLLAELDKVKEGQFEDWLLKAVIDNKRKEFEYSRNDPESGQWVYLGAFVSGTPYADELAAIERMSQITKKQIAEFAKNSFGNHVRINKVKGAPKGRTNVEKPKLTPVAVDGSEYSDYYKSFIEIPSGEPVKPEFIDFKKDFSIEDIAGQGGRLFYNKKLMPANDKLFEFSMIVNAGAYHGKKLSLAIGYLNYLGTDKYSADELRNEFYKLAVSFNISAGKERTVASVSGFTERLPQALSLLDHFIKNMRADKAAYDRYIAGIIKSRADAKTRFQTVAGVAGEYAAYGPDSPTVYANSITEKELAEINPDELVALAKNYLSNYSAICSYIGSMSENEVKKVISETIWKARGSVKTTPPKKDFIPVDVTKPKVYLVNFDSAQANISFRTRSTLYRNDELADIQLFNQYFGAGGLDCIVFMEIRESRSLAYSAFAYYKPASEIGKYNTFVGAVGTQSDKLFEAADAMLALFKNMPVKDDLYENARGNLIKEMSSERINGDLVYVYLDAVEKLKIDYDIRKSIFEELAKLTIKDGVKFFNSKIANSRYNIVIVGNIAKLDRSRLAAYGEIIELKYEDIFGY